MKTKKITSLKKELLLVELPENKNTFDDLIFLNSEIEGYTLLGTPDEIKEDDAKELVNLHESGYYKDYINVNNFFTLPSKSLLSALESEIYWVNPLGKEEPNKSYFLDDNGSFLRQEKKQWYEAQEKTFEKSRTLIFVKN